MIRNFLDRVFEFVKARWPFLLIAAGFLLLLMRMHWGFRVLAAVVFVLAVLTAIVGAIVTIYDAFNQRPGDPRFIIRLRLRAQQARERILKLNGEMRGIEQKIQHLEQISSTEDQQHTHKQYGKSLALRAGYEKELQLRSTKLDFYRKSLQTLTELESKWMQERQLDAMERDLDSLRTPNEEDSRRMKALREELLFENKLLTTYQQLSKKIDKANTVQGAQELKGSLDDLLQ